MCTSARSSAPPRPAHVRSDRPPSRGAEPGAMAAKRVLGLRRVAAARLTAEQAAAELPEELERWVERARCRRPRSRKPSGALAPAAPHRLALSSSLSLLRRRLRRQEAAIRLRRMQRLLEPPGPPERTLSRQAMEQIR